MICVYISCPSKEEAEKIASALIEKKLVACATISPPFQSIYWWENKITRHEDYVILGKTKKANFEKIKKFVNNMHSYEVPCIVAWDVPYSLESYKEWVEDVTK